MQEKANVHSTLSGNSMLKLYRATGEKRYLEWMRRISHAIPQFVSLEDRRLDTLAGKTLLLGFINESGAVRRRISK